MIHRAFTLYVACDKWRALHYIRSKEISILTVGFGIKTLSSGIGGAKK
jgi:hypothetical protein